MSNEGDNGPNSGEKQPNPFADDLSDPPYSADPFAAPQSGGFDQNVAGHYESTAPDRGSSLMFMAVTGLIVSIVGAIALFCCYPVNLLALALTLPAWVLARSDLHGMALGAIDSSNRRQTRTAAHFALAGALLALLPFVVAIVMLIAGVGTEAMLEFRESLGY
jgi:hypothetical protein